MSKQVFSLAPGSYVVFSDGSLLLNPATGLPQRFPGLGGAKATAKPIGGAVLTVIADNFAWGE